jgi:hypothetical protein
MINLRKPTHALTFLGTQNGGDHDLEIRGEILARTSDTVTVKVTRVKGGGTGRRYPHLDGTKIVLPLVCSVLF